MTRTADYLPPAQEVASASQKVQNQVLDILFEPSPALHSLCRNIFETEGIATYEELIAAIGKRLNALAKSASSEDSNQLHSILCSHPRLGANAVDSAQSRSEQASLQTGDRREAFVLAELNEAYERTFPGLRYVYYRSTFVKGRPRSAVMQDMRDRIQHNTQKQEELDTIKAMCDIATDRVTKLSS